MLKHASFLKEMMKRPVACLLAGALIASGVQAEEQSGSLQDRLERFYTFEESVVGRETNEKSQLLEERYDELFPSKLLSGDLSRTPVADLKTLFQATSTLAFYTLDMRDIEYMAHVFKELQHRSAINNRQVKDMFGAFLSVRSFNKASKIAAKYPEVGLERVPDVSGEYGGNLYSIYSLDNASLKLGSIPPPTQGGFVVVVGHPLCNFTSAAVADIEANSVLRGILKENSLWIAPPERRLYLEVIRTWNEAHPSAHMHLALHREDWPGLDAWGTPTFYFFKDGILVEKIAGWPGPERAQDIIGAWARATARSQSPKD